MLTKRTFFGFTNVCEHHLKINAIPVVTQECDVKVPTNWVCYTRYAKTQLTTHALYLLSVCLNIGLILLFVYTFAQTNLSVFNNEIYALVTVCSSVTHASRKDVILFLKHISRAVRS
jgi:hypothetical protein